MKVVNHNVPVDAIHDSMIAAVTAMKTTLMAQPDPKPVHFVLVVIGEGAERYPRVASNFTPAEAQELFALLASIPPGPGQETVQ